MSMTTLLFLIKCNPIIGPVNFFITTKYSAKELSPISNFSVAVDNGFSNLYLKIGRVVGFENVIGGLLFDCIQVILGDCTDKCS